MFVLDNKVLFVYFCCHGLLGSLNIFLIGRTSFALPHKRAKPKLETHLKIILDPWMKAVKNSSILLNVH